VGARARARRWANRLPRRRADPELERYVLDGERLAFAKRMHLFAVAEPLLTAVGVVAAAIWLVVHLPPSGQRTVLPDVLFWVSFAAFGRGVWRVAEWAWRDRLVMTDKRIMLIHGWWNREVPMMPHIKVTDMTFRRSLPGRIFGYGTFIIESAGQDQALRTINWVRHPELTYRQVCAEVFKVDDHARVLDDGDPAPRFDDRPGTDAPGSGGPGSGGPGSGGQGGVSSGGGGRSGDGGRSGQRPRPTTGRDEGNGGSASPVVDHGRSRWAPRGGTGRPGAPAGARPASRTDAAGPRPGETLYRSPDLVVPKADDTTPIPVVEEWWT
jgi:uncharacterized membrane protein YgcG